MNSLFLYLKYKITLIFLISCIFFSLNAWSQVRSNEYKSPKRTAIDKERETLWYFDKDGLKKSKEFIRQDSTYYIGYLYEGAYKYFHAEDKIGYRNAIKTLEKARRLLKKDYSAKLKIRTSDFNTFFRNYKYQEDFCMIIYLLEQAYSNMEESDKALAVVLDLKNKNLQKEFYIGSWYTIAWIYHRNRMHTSEKYPFLKNSIRENDSIALRYLDSAELTYKKNLSLNRRIFYANFIEDDLYSIFHYRSLIFSYSLQIDSAEYYYQRLMEKPYFPDNNYAHFKLASGEIEAAEHYFKKAQQKETNAGGDKRIKESNYMLSIIDIYKGKPIESILSLEKIIKQQGSTPGYGWHNLALARAYFYEGDIKSSIKHTEKASKFEELHIGTTWVPEQYQTMALLLKYLNKDREIKGLKFENNPYWYSGTVLRKLPTLLVDKYLLQLALANNFATNPEREMITYRIFSSENLATFDEIWYLIKDFNSDFFLKKFKAFLKTDPRKKIGKYYRYFIAKILIEKGENEQAKKELEAILKEEELNPLYENLLIARIHEALGEIAYEMNDTKNYNNNLLKLYKIYPQLIPFSSLKMKFQLKTLKKDFTEEEQKIIDDLKNCRIEWTSDQSVPIVQIGFTKNGKKKELFYEVVSPKGETYISRSVLQIDPQEEMGKKLAYRLFDIYQ